MNQLTNQQQAYALEIEEPIKFNTPIKLEEIGLSNISLEKKILPLDTKTLKQLNLRVENIHD